MPDARNRSGSVHLRRHRLCTRRAHLGRITGSKPRQHVLGDPAACCSIVWPCVRSKRREQAQWLIPPLRGPTEQCGIWCIIKSLPGIGPRLGARILIEIGDIRQFRTPAQLAAYAGLGPTPHQSGTSIRGNRITRFGNHRLKNAFFLAAFSSLKHPPSRSYYDRKRNEGKRHTQAVLCLARRRVDVLHAMLTTKTSYRAPTLQADLETAA